MAQKISAPVIDRMQPEILMRSLLIRMTRSASLFEQAVNCLWSG